MTRKDEIYVGGYQEHAQLDPADSLAGELRDDPLDAGYSPPDREPRGLRLAGTDAEVWAGESLDQRLAEEEPDWVDDAATAEDLDRDRRAQQPRAGRLVAPSAGALRDDEATEIATDVGRAGWAASAEEAAVHILTGVDEDDAWPDPDESSTDWVG